MTDVTKPQPLISALGIMPGKKPSISVVVPVYKCEQCLQPLCERLEKVLASVTDRYEILLVDDRSPDCAWAIIQHLKQEHSAVRGIRLSRNFGQHIAISAGLSISRGDYIVVMDCDLQDPPEKIPELLDKLGEGYDLVLARRSTRSHSTFRVYAASMYFYLLGMLSNKKIDGSYGTFSVLTRKVVDSFLKFTERERHYLFIIRWLGFKAGEIEYEHQKRAAGRSAYTLGRLMQHAVDGVIFQSTVALRSIVGMGLLFSLAGLIFAAFSVYRYFMVGALQGWTSIVVLLLVCTGVILVSVGTIGLYIGKIFDQIKGRPLYVVDTISEGASTW